MLIETRADLLDNEHPDAAIMRETQEETGYHPTAVRRALRACLSPGSVTERLFAYPIASRTGPAAGQPDERPYFPRFQR